MNFRCSSLLVPALAIVLSACSKEEAPRPAKHRAPATTASAAAAATAAGNVPEPPASLGKINVPSNNPLTAAKVELGHQLFFDKRLSVDGSKACYSCHMNEDGTGGHDPVAVGPKEKLTRHAPIMWNVGYLPRLYWDGRAESLEALSKAALAGGNMANGEDGLVKKAQEIEAVAGYKKQFDDIFPGDGVTVDTIAMALASYQRTLFCGDTVWDRFNAGDQSALNDDQKKGWALFTGKAGCNNCHTPPFFSDAYTTEQGAYHNIGMGLEGIKEADADIGRMKVTQNPSDWAVFKTPTLRNVVNSPPYFHNGSRAKLEDAVRFMAGGGYKNKNRDPKLEDKHLSDDEIKQIIAFLGSIACPGKLEEPKLP